MWYGVKAAEPPRDAYGLGFPAGYRRRRGRRGWRSFCRAECAGSAGRASGYNSCGSRPSPGEMIQWQIKRRPRRALHAARRDSRGG
jgi:hypothetical protein